MWVNRVVSAVSTAGPLSTQLLSNWCGAANDAMCQLQTCDLKSSGYRRPNAAKLGADAGGTLDRRDRNVV